MKVQLFAIASLLLATATSATALDYNNPSQGWRDSFSNGGICWVDSGYDHGAGSLTVSTPQGNKTIKQVAAQQIKVYGSKPSASGNPMYNDVQCGNGPANDAGDENPGECPGRVDVKGQCDAKGPLYDVAKLFPASGTSTPVVTTPTVKVAAAGATQSIAATLLNNATKQPSVDCDPIGTGWICANFENPTASDITLGSLPVAEAETPAIVPVATSPPATLDCNAVTTADDFRSCVVNNGTIALGSDITYGGTTLSFINKANVTVDGNGHTIKRTSGQWEDSLVIVNASENITFSDITFDDNENVPACTLDQKCAPMIHIKDSTTVSFDDTTVLNSSAYALYTNNVDGFRYTNGELSNSGILGMYIGHSSNASNEVYIANNAFKDNSTNALALLGANNAQVLNNTFTGNHYVGQWPVAAQYGTGITGGGQVYIAQATNVIFDGNTIDDGECLTCRGAVTGLELSIPAKTDFVNNITISNNTITNNTGKAISSNVGAVINGLTVTNNVLANNASGGYTNDDGSTPVVVETPVVETPVVETPVVETPVVETPVSAKYGTFAATDAEAAQSLRAAYPGETHADCDPVGDGWVCSNVAGTVLTLDDVTFGPTTLETETPVVETPEVETPEVETPVVETPTTDSGTPTTDSGRVAVVGNSLQAAISAYNSATSLSRDDCDPVGDGRWVCANFNNPKLSDVATTVETPVVETPEVETPEVETPTNTTGRVAVIGNDLQLAISAYNAATSSKRADCDPVGDGRWICANFNNPKLSDVTGDTSGGSTGGDADINLGEGQIPSSALFSTGDFIAMQYDSCPDPDDIHSSVAGRMVLDYYGLGLNSDYAVANGTCGYDLNRSNYLTYSPQIFTKLYGNQGSTATWLNAFDNEASSASAMAAKWKVALESGNKVWVAEGGPSDFTYKVIKALEGIAGNNVNYKNITVVQHSAGSSAFNEQRTDDSNLAYIKNKATWLAIANGNAGGNATADLHTDGEQSRIARFKANPEYGDEWTLAFDIAYGNNNTDKMDASDTVELMWIMGLDSGDVANWQEFEDKFMPTEARTSTDTNTDVDADAPVQTGTTIKIEAESVSVGTGWQVDTDKSGYSGSGYIRWYGGNDFSNPGRGVTTYTFTVTNTGTYQLALRSRGHGSDSTENNDVWVQMDGVNVTGRTAWNSYAKIYTSHGDQWATGGTGDFHSGHQKLQQVLTAGNTYTLELSGRSQNYSIDYIELVKQ